MGIQHIIIHEVRRAKASIEGAEDMIISKIKDKENDVSKLDADLAIGLVRMFTKANFMLVNLL